MRRRRQSDRHDRDNRRLMAIGEHLPASVARLSVEAAVRRIIARDGLEQVGGRIGRGRLVGKLAGIAGLGEIAINQPRRDAIGEDRLDRRPADPDVASLMRGGEKDGAGRHFGLEDRCDRLGLAPHLVERPVELRGIDRGQIDHRQMHVELVVDDLATKAVGKASDRRLGAAIDRLQRHRTIGKRRADVDNGAAIAHAHPLQRRHHAVHLSEISDFRSALDLFRGQFGDGGKYRRHRDIHPDIDRPEFRFGTIGGCLHRSGIGDIGRDRQGAHAHGDVASSAARSSRAGSRDSSATSKPCRANSSAVARPTPAPAPVITATFGISSLPE